jgi:8-oxo-dGTP diphosphatase
MSDAQSGDAAARDRHRVAVDTIITQDDRVALIKRKYEPFEGMWCIPGGHVEQGEQVQDAAKREAREELGIAVEIDDLLGIYDDPGRDPRGPVISLTYICSTDDTEPDPATDAAAAQWFPLDDLPANLGFDHAEILDDFMEHRDDGN